MSSTKRPEWLPDEYDPDASLIDRLRIIAEIEGGIELHVKGDTGVVEIVGSPQHHHENPRRFHLTCGSSPDNWRWEINIPKKEGVPPTLDRVDPNQSVEAYEATKRHWLRIDDVRIYGVDLDRYFNNSDDGLRADGGIETRETVYRTRIVFKDRNRHDEGLNLWDDPEEAKHWLEEYVRIRYDAEPGEWHEDSHAGEKWTMYPDGIEGRAVVMGHPVRQDAEPVLDSVRETMEKIRGGRPA